MKILVNCSRFLVGILFVFSGLIKANDPLGLSYKMQEFFESWNMPGWEHFTLGLSLVMIVFEILAGVAILLGWKMKLFSWLLLLLIIFFTFLTGYALFSGKIKECGCFGNCIPLTAGQSFAKDIFLLVLIVFLFIFRNKIKPIFPDSANLLVLFFTLVFSFSFQWYVLHFLPVVDCLPYRIGASIIENRKAPAGAIPDSTVISLVYNRNGKEVEFTAAHFPADFDDSYHFVRRYDKLIRKGNAEPAIKDFSLFTPSGYDSTQDILAQKGYTMLLFAMDIAESNPSWNKEFATILSLLKLKKMEPLIVTSNPESINN
ncbi:MAG: BT_3928 family protein, partial [Chitinophagales bacterium]